MVLTKFFNDEIECCVKETIIQWFGKSSKNYLAIVFVSRSKLQNNEGSLIGIKPNFKLSRKFIEQKEAFLTVRQIIHTIT